ncbi:MAG: bifunctional folylpolyglutamate synthase/dihydrofolate synthase [Clostridia bacterium]|nr:bifunctional folylpolyglutamate synthase/dihydrofolate synthase [Clostridia bacterium]
MKEQRTDCGTTGTYKDTLAYIHAHPRLSGEPTLARITALLDKLGNPQKELRIVHVAGTNGKGSVCAMLASVLQACGLRTGLYISPFMLRFNERICLDGEPISDRDLVDLFNRVRPFAGQVGPLSEFELITAAAFLYFKEQKTDVVVLETGLGGRFDPTNATERVELSVITGVDLDHTRVLGDTVEQIAREKAGIIKPSCPVLYGGENESVWQIVRQTAESVSSPAYRTNPDELRVLDFSVHGTVLAWKKETEPLRLSLLGRYQVQNAATVLCALERLKEAGWPVTGQGIRKGLEAVRWPGRFECLERSVPLFFDGAHNPQGIRAALDSIEVYFPGRKVDLLTSVMKDKDYPAMARMLAPHTMHVFCTQSQGDRALPASELEAVYRSFGVPGTALADLKEALRRAVTHAGEAGVPLFVLGSLYSYGPVVRALDELREEHLLDEKKETGGA